jgi:hypothetical protein
LFVFPVADDALPKVAYYDDDYHLVLFAQKNVSKLITDTPASNVLKSSVEERIMLDVYCRSNGSMVESAEKLVSVLWKPFQIEVRPHSL